MAIPPESITTTTTCAHCERDIPSSNIDLHYVHCSSKLQKCSICGDMVPKKHSDEHYNEHHAPVDCSLCNQSVDRENWSLHKGQTCPQRIVTCEYCEFPLPAVDVSKHQEICGNRTEYCQLCNKYVRLRERVAHEIQFHGSSSSAETSRNDTEQAARRRQARESSQRRILFTIAVTGAAVLMGSIFLQRRDSHQH